LLRTPQGEFTVIHGTTLLGAISPPRADTHFRIASNTKTMTAAVIVLLAQEGKLSLDDPVWKYVPGVPDGDKITITELLKMRSGLYSYDDDPEFWAILDRDPTKVWSPAEVLAIAFKHPPYFPTGTAFHYSNANYALLGLIAEKIDGKPLASCFQDRLFGPLGLKDTLLPAITSNTLPDPYSHGYVYGIPQLRWGANTVYFTGGEMPGFNSFMGYDPASKMTLVVWTNLTVSLDGKVTANALMLKVLDQIYVVSPLPPWPSPIN